MQGKKGERQASTSKKEEGKNMTIKTKKEQRNLLEGQNLKVSDVRKKEI